MSSAIALRHIAIAIMNRVAQQAFIRSRYARAFHDRPTLERNEMGSSEAVGYVAHIFVHSALPYRMPVDDRGIEVEHWKRESGKCRLVIESGSRLVATGDIDRHGRPVERLQRIGIPYGSFPRILLADLTSEVVLKRQPEIELGSGVREWFGKMGIRCTGGPNGTVRAVRTQLDRLLNAKISITEDGEAPREGQFLLAEGQRHGARAWWRAADGKQMALWQPRILLSPTFFDSLKHRAMPINLRAMTALSQSPLAMDLYVWLTYRSDELRSNPKLVPWIALWNQFGSDSAMNKFQENVRRALRRVQTVHPELTVKAERRGLSLHAFKSSVPRLAA